MIEPLYTVEQMHKNLNIYIFERYFQYIK